MDQVVAAVGQAGQHVGRVAVDDPRPVAADAGRLQRGPGRALVLDLDVDAGQHAVLGHGLEHPQRRHPGAGADVDDGAAGQRGGEHREQGAGPGRDRAPPPARRRGCGRRRRPGTPRPSPRSRSSWRLWRRSSGHSSDAGAAGYGARRAVLGEQRRYRARSQVVPRLPGNHGPRRSPTMDASAPTSSPHQPRRPRRGGAAPCRGRAEVLRDASGEVWVKPTWEQVVREHSGRVYRLAYRLTGNPHDAEDITQEVFVRVFRSLDSYRPGTFEGWLHRITTNLFLDSVRRKQRQKTDALAEDAAERLPGREPGPGARVRVPPPRRRRPGRPGRAVARLPRRRRPQRHRGPQLRGDRHDAGRQARHRALPHPPRPRPAAPLPRAPPSRPGPGRDGRCSPAASPEPGPVPRLPHPRTALSGYADARLPAWRRAVVEHHLRGCTRCAVEVGADPGRSATCCAPRRAARAAAGPRRPPAGPRGRGRRRGAGAPPADPGRGPGAPAGAGGPARTGRACRGAGRRGRPARARWWRARRSPGVALVAGAPARVPATSRPVAAACPVAATAVLTVLPRPWAGGAEPDGAVPVRAGR